MLLKFTIILQDTYRISVLLRTAKYNRIHSFRTFSKFAHMHHMLHTMAVK